jgi:methionine-S-sulfoxide reductase
VENPSEVQLHCPVFPVGFFLIVFFRRVRILCYNESSYFSWVTFLFGSKPDIYKKYQGGGRMKIIGQIVENTGFLLLGFALVSLLSAPDAGAAEKRKKAIFAGGCFWCMEKPFEQLDGVFSVTSGYIGGQTENPTYENYGAGGHVEAVEILYDPVKVSYAKLLDVFWRQIDPADSGGQFVDRGHAYTTGIFYLDEEQRQLAEKSKNELADSKLFAKPIVTPILAATKFYPAEEYHQDYYKKNPIRYRIYRGGSGRDQFLEKIWGDESRAAKKWSEAELRHRLTCYFGRTSRIAEITDSGFSSGIP